jgi:hypothetical protein
MKVIEQLKSDHSFIQVFGLDDDRRHLGNLCDAFDAITNRYPEGKFFIAAALIQSPEDYAESEKLLADDKFEI